MQHPQPNRVQTQDTYQHSLLITETTTHRNNIVVSLPELVFVSCRLSYEQAVLICISARPLKMLRDTDVHTRMTGELPHGMDRVKCVTWEVRFCNTLCM